MKAVMLSIRPEWCEKIAQGRKSMELRKSKPKIELPFKCYIYCTIGCPTPAQYEWCDYEPYGVVIGEFMCDAVLSHCEMANADLAEQMSRVRREKIREYSGGKEVFGWHISDLVIYDKPKELNEFLKPCIHGEKDISCFECEKSGYSQDLKIECYNRMERAPQSWCYVSAEGAQP